MKKLQIPNSKRQRSSKLQAQKPTCAPFVPVSVLEVLCFEIWNFSGACGLVLGVSLSDIAFQIQLYMRPTLV